MSTLSSLLRTGAGALTAQQSRLDTIQNNLSNATTPGYRRQRVDQVTLGAHIKGDQAGVYARPRRSIDAPLLDTWIPHERGTYGENQAMMDLASLAEAALSTEVTSLQDRFDAFYASLRRLETDPASMISRRDVLAQAESLTDTMRSSYESVQSIRENIAAQAEDLGISINDSLTAIAELDRRIQSGDGGPEMVDERDRLIDGLSEDVGLRVTRSDRGFVSLVTGNGQTLLEGGRARSIEVEIDATGDVRILGANGQEIEPVGGRLGGMLRANEEVMSRSLGQLDELATGFAAQINGVHSSGVALDGQIGRDLFEFGGAPGAGTLTVNAEILEDPNKFAAAATTLSTPGGNEIVQAMLATQDQPVANGLGFQRFTSNITGDVAQSLNSAESAAMASAESLTHLEKLQSSISGVSIEEEMIALTQAKHALEAATRVVQVGDEMMESILRLA